jgi:hypothetical protein
MQEAGSSQHGHALSDALAAGWPAAGCQAAAQPPGRQLVAAGAAEPAVWSSPLLSFATRHNGDGGVTPPILLTSTLFTTAIVSQRGPVPGPSCWASPARKTTCSFQTLCG